MTPGSHSADNAIFVAIAGNIGTGKSGLTSTLAKALGGHPLLERVDANPFFERSYDEPARWTFSSQVAFAADSLRRHIEAIGRGSAVQDRTAFEAHDVFAQAQQQLGHLTADDMSVLSLLRESAAALPRQPDVLLYLHAPVSTLVERIARRDRVAERHVNSVYLELIQAEYERFASGWNSSPVLSLDTEARDLRNQEEINALLVEVTRLLRA